MLSLLLLTLVLVAVCCLLGQGLLALFGWEEWRWWAPAVGFAALLVAFGQLVRLPHHQTDLILVVALCSLAALAMRSVRAGIAGALPTGVPLALGVLLLAAIPFFAAGHTGILGTGVSDDMSQHLLAAYYLRTHDSLLPAAAIGGDLITTGYPLGPHGLAAALARASGLGEETAFSAITLAIPVMAAAAAMGLVPEGRRAARWALAVVIGLGYLPTAYLAQGSFKETTQALLVLAAALLLADIVAERRPGWRRGMPLGILTGAAIYNYSYGGALWFVALGVLLLVSELVRNIRRPLATLRRLAPAALGALVMGALTIAPEIHRIQHFKKSIFGAEPLTNHGNLSHAIHPLETLGVWFAGDFRFNPQPRWPSLAASVVAIVVLVVGLRWWWRRRELALPVAVVASLGVWIELALTRNIYNAAKGLVVVAPVLMACVGAPLAAAWGARAKGSGRRLVKLVGLGLMICALVATFSVLRSAPVGIGAQAKEFSSFRALLHGNSVVYFNNNHFAQWELRGSHLWTTSLLYAPRRPPNNPLKLGGNPVDSDNLTSATLDTVSYIVTSNGPYASEVPPNFKLVRTTASYNVYHRHGATPVREPIEPPGEPGATLDCRSPRGQSYRRQFRWAGVLPRPVVQTNWVGAADKPGKTARMRVTLPRGRWDVSLQYISPTGLEMRAPHLHRLLTPSFGPIFPYWFAGTLSSSGRPLTLSATVRDRSWFGGLLGAPRPTRAPNSPNVSPLWHVAFTRHAETPRRVRTSSACGLYADWFAPAGSAMTGRSGNGG